MGKDKRQGYVTLSIEMPIEVADWLAANMQNAWARRNRCSTCSKASTVFLAINTTRTHLSWFFGFAFCFLFDVWKPQRQQRPCMRHLPQLGGNT